MENQREPNVSQDLEQLLVKSDVEGASTTFVLIFSAFIAVCGSFVVGCAAGFSSPVQSAIVTDLGLSTADFSLFGSLLTAGGLLGSLVSGKLTDHIGRRGAMGLSSVLGIAGWLSITCSQGAWLLDLGRLTLGLANGLIAYVVPVYVAEIAPKNLRGGLVLIHQFMVCCGVFLVFAAGLFVSWRILALIGTLPCIIQLLGLPFIPESPRWLVTVSQDEGYIMALQRLRGTKVDVSQEAANILGRTRAVESVSEDNFCNMFHSKYAYPLSISLGLMALSQLSGAYGILFYATAIFESAGFSGTIGTLAMGLVQLPPTALGVFLMQYSEGVFMGQCNVS